MIESDITNKILAEILAKQKEIDEKNGGQTPEGINQTLPTTMPQVSVPQQKYPELTKEDLEKVRQGESIYDIINRLYKPDELDEQRLRNNRTIGAIGDSVRLLAQMFGVSRGAHIQNLNPEDSLTNYFAKEENRIRDIYRQNRKAYNRLRLNTALKEYERQKKNEEQLRQEKVKQDEITQKQDLEREKIKAKTTSDENNLKQKESQFDRQQTAREAQYKASNAIRYAAINKKVENSNNADKNYYIKLAAKARTDKEFLKYLEDIEGYYVTKTDRNGLNYKELIRDNAQIGAAYDLYLENKDNAQQQNAQPEQTQSGNFQIPYRPGYVPTPEETNPNSQTSKTIGW